MKNGFGSDLAKPLHSCFEVTEPQMTVDDAIGVIRSRIAPSGATELIALDGADNRVLACDVAAPSGLPLFTNSAVDGYAVDDRDLLPGSTKSFAVSARIPAGAEAEPMTRGSVVRIFTGAPLPDGRFTVCMQEDVAIDCKGRARLPAGMKPGANVRWAGEDVAQGSVVLPAGRRLRPQDLALAIAVGVTHVRVHRHIRVAVFSTGDELASAGGIRGPAQIFDSNKTMLAAMLTRLGCIVTDLGILHDEQDQLAEALKDAAKSHDLVLTSGGVSTGEEDHVRAAVERVGTIMFWRLAVKPGRPVAMGMIGGTPFIGLPGNPVASFVMFANIVRPTVLALSGASELQPPSSYVRAGFAYSKKPGRREYIRVSVRAAADGFPEAVKFAHDGTSFLTSLTETDGLAELGESLEGVEPGQMIRFLPYGLLG